MRAARIRGMPRLGAKVRAERGAPTAASRYGASATNQPLAPICGPCLHPRHVVLEEDLRDEVAPASHTDLLEDRLQVVLHGVLGEVQLPRNLGRTEAVEDELGDLALPRRQPVGGDDERGDLRRSRRLEDDRDSPLGGIADNRAVNGQPRSHRRRHAGARALRSTATRGEERAVRDAVHDRRQIAFRGRRRDERAQPALGRRRDRLDRAVRREQDQSRGIGLLVGRYGREKDRAPQSLREERRERVRRAQRRRARSRPPPHGGRARPTPSTRRRRGA